MKRVLKNASFDKTPTICIIEGAPEWDAAYKNWLSGKNPTSDAAWKDGVFMSFKKDGNNE